MSNSQNAPNPAHTTEHSQPAPPLPQAGNAHPQAGNAARGASPSKTGPRARKATNPFYVLLVIVGVLFVLTASAYGVMTLRMIEPSAEPESHGLVTFMDQHGFTVLMVELGVLAVATFAAIGTDSWWTGESTHRGPRNQE